MPNDPARSETTEGWPDAAGQFDAHKVTAADLDRWEEMARFEAWRIKPGRFNWPGAMRSLIAEVRRLKATVDITEQEATRLERECQGRPFSLSCSGSKWTADLAVMTWAAPLLAEWRSANAD